MYTPSHAHKDNPPRLYLNNRPWSPAFSCGGLDSRGGIQVAPVSPVLTRLHPSSRVECECVV